MYCTLIARAIFASRDSHSVDWLFTLIVIQCVSCEFDEHVEAYTYDTTANQPFLFFGKRAYVFDRFTLFLHPCRLLQNIHGYDAVDVSILKYDLLSFIFLHFG